MEVEWEGGHGRIVGWVSRGRTKKIFAIVLVRRSFVAVPIGELKLVRAPKK
jgi:hypothetical protein